MPIGGFAYLPMLRRLRLGFGAAPPPTNPFGIPTNFPLGPEAYGSSGPPRGYSTYTGATGGGGDLGGIDNNLPPAANYPSSTGEPTVITNGRSGYPNRGNASPVVANPSDDWIWNATSTDNLGNPLTGPDLSNAPPVTAYPTPGSGGTPTGNWMQNARAATNWQQNARSGYQPWQRSAIAAANAFGFGHGSAEHPAIGGSFTQTSEFPSFAGFLAPPAFGNMKYIL